MSITFKPIFSITSSMTRSLMSIEASKQIIEKMPLSVPMLTSLRKTAHILSTHYSTMIEGNRLSAEETEDTLHKNVHFPGRERDENEVKGYYAALQHIEELTQNKGDQITEAVIKKLHALVLGRGKTIIKPTPYRDGQNIIREGRSGQIVYLPPEPQDVANLMKALVFWLNETHNTDLLCPIQAGIAHYEFVTIHPYFDGNGRTARLLTNLVLHHGGYGLNGIFSLEEYYAQDLNRYYEALTIGPSHNYYEGRAEADITPWLEYFLDGMAYACKQIEKHAIHHSKQPTASKSHEVASKTMRSLDADQRKALTLFNDFDVASTSQIGVFFGFKPGSTRQLCQKWVESGFLEIVDPSNRGRKYRLGKAYQHLIPNVSST